MSYDYLLETGERFALKREAFLKASEVDPPTPVYLDTGVDVSQAAQETTKPIKDVFIEECHWLKQQNGKIIILYSGGSDSYFRIQHFIQAGIPIDEIVVVDGSVGRAIPDPLTTEWQNLWCEIPLVAIPYLKEYSKEFPKTKITILKAEDYLRELPPDRDYVKTLAWTRFLARGLQHLACPALYRYDVPVIPGYTVAGYADDTNVYIRFSDRVHNPHFSHGSPRFMVQYMRAMYEAYLRHDGLDDIKYDLYGSKPNVYRADKTPNHSDPRRQTASVAMELFRLPQYQQEHQNQVAARKILTQGIHEQFIRDDGLLVVVYMKPQPCYAGNAIPEFVRDMKLSRDNRVYLVT